MNGMRIVLAALVITCSVVIAVSFFMPWAKARISVTKVAENLTESAETTLKGTPFAEKFIKTLQKATVAIGSVGNIEVKTAVSGFDIPTMVNKKSSKIAIALAQLLFKDAEDLDKKSFLVYLLPLAAIACAALAIGGLRSTAVVIVMCILSGVIAITGLYNLLTAKLSNMAVQISIERGLWQTVYGFLMIFILSLIWLSTATKRRKGMVKKVSMLVAIFMLAVMVMSEISYAQVGLAVMGARRMKKKMEEKQQTAEQQAPEEKEAVYSNTVKVDKDSGEMEEVKPVEAQ